MNRFRYLVALLACLVLATFAHAQAEPAQEMTEITLGQSLIPLYGPWKFTVGDSPVDPATNTPLWAQPGFDDSQWETVDLKPKGALDPLGGFSGYVLGWTALGHPGHTGYGWYRIRVRVAAQPGQKLALAGPAYVDDAYQLFSNGTLIGSFGRFTGKQPSIYLTQPMMFDLPQTPLVNGVAHGPERVLAFRVWMSPNTLVTQADTGGIHTAPQLGNANAISAEYQLRLLELVRAHVTGVVEGFLFLGLAIVAFSLTRLDRSDPVYLWIAAAFLLVVANDIVLITIVWTQYIDAIVGTVLTDAILAPLLFASWVMVWWVWFRLQRPAWLPRAVALLTLAYAVTIFIGEDLLYPLISVQIGETFHVASIAVRLAFLVLLVLVVIWGVRRQGAEGWLVLPAVLLLVVAQFSDELMVLHIRIDFFPFGIRVNLNQMANLLLLVVVSVLLLRRLLISVREQRLLALDVKQAQEVQRVILPESLTNLPGLTIENEYRPAREVGGDFYQILPQPDDSLLIVAGDVAGKGLQAGMLVALLVGAIRSIAEINADPLFLLQGLNRRLLGRNEANATCLAMRIAADGAVTLANAGHLPPYLNGQPIAMEGALPLGVINHAEFTVTHFQLHERDRLVLASDGIVEAMDEQGQLFGFERVQELVRDRLTAAELATAAQKFGQEDDISVITVTRTASLVPA